jgi:hypothetical protein
MDDRGNTLFPSAMKHEEAITALICYSRPALGPSRAQYSPVESGYLENRLASSTVELTNGFPRIQSTSRPRITPSTDRLTASSLLYYSRYRS